MEASKVCEKKVVGSLKKRAKTKVLAVLLFFVIATVFLNALSTQAQQSSVPEIITYQGRLADANGDIVGDGSYNFVFKIYDASTGGNCLWVSKGTCGTPTTISLNTTNGIFSVNLGDTTVAGQHQNALDIAFSAGLYLAVTVGADSEMTPRKSLTAVPFAYSATTLVGLEPDADGSTTSSVLITNASGNVVITGNPGSALVSGGSLYVNPSTANIATNETIFGVAVSDVPKFMIDAEGDMYVQGVVSSTGAISTSSTLQTTGLTTMYGGFLSNSSSTVSAPFNVSGTSTFTNYTNIVGRVGQPTHKGSITDGQGGALLGGAIGVFVSGNYAYVAANSEAALEIIDISTSTHPTHVSSLTHGTGGALLSSPFSVFVSGNYAYVAARGSNALEIIDISNAASPTHKGSITNGTGGALLSNPQFVHVVGNYAYVTANGNNALEIVDVSDPANPRHKGKISHGAGGALLSGTQGLTVSGNYAYVVSNISGALEIVDVSDPANPAHVGALSGLGSALSVDVAGNYAYVAEQNGNLYIIDVSNPAWPRLKSTFSDSGSTAFGGAFSVTVAGSYAYVVGSTDNGLSVIDVSNPSSPRHAGSITNGTGGALLDDPRSVFVSGNYVYVVSFTNGTLEIIDVSGASISNFEAGNGKIGNLQIMGDAFFDNSISVRSGLSVGAGLFVDGPSAINGGLTIASSTATSVTSSPQFLIIGSSNHSPNIMEWRTSTSSPRGYIDASGWIYAGNGTVTSTFQNDTLQLGRQAGSMGGLFAVDASGNINTSGTLRAFNGFISNASSSVTARLNTQTIFTSSTVVIGGGPSSTLSVDGRIAYPQHHFATSSLLLDATTDVFVSGNYLYALSAATSDSLIIFENTSGTLRFISSFKEANMNTPVSLSVVGNYAYVVDDDSFYIFDVSNPVSTTLKARLLNGDGGALLDTPYEVFIQGMYAYVVSGGSDALEIIDISDPSNPRHKGALSNGAGGALLSDPYGLYVHGNFAYIASSGSNALEIVDVSDPANPKHAGSLAHGVGGASLTSASDVVISWPYAYVAAGTASSVLEVVDVSNPYSPQHRGSVGALSSPFKLAISGDYIYVTEFDGSAIRVIDISNPSSPRRVAQLADGAGGALLNTPRGIFAAGNFVYVASTLSDAIEVVDVSGVTLTNFTAGNGVVDVLQVTNRAQFMDTVTIKNSLNIGRGLLVDGPSAINGGLTIASSTATSATTSPQFLIIGSANFSPNIMEWRTSGNNPRGYIDASGWLFVGNGSITSTFQNSALQIARQAGNLGGLFAIDASGNVSASGTIQGFGLSTLRAGLISIGSSTVTGGLYVGGNLSSSSTATFNNVTISGTCTGCGGVGATNPNFTTPISVTVSSVGSLLRQNEFYIATSTSNLGGLFRVSTTGGISASGTAQFFATSTFNDLAIAKGRVLSPRHKSKITHAAGIVELNSPDDLYVSGGYAYVVGNYGLQIIDVASSTGPSPRGSVAIGNAVDVVVSGNNAYVISSDTSGLYVIDVTNSASPTVQGTIFNGAGGAVLSSPREIAVVGKYAYVLTAAALEIVDISVPANPRHAGVFNSGADGVIISDAIDMTISGNYAYIADTGGAKVIILDISNPFNPRRASIISTGVGSFLGPELLAVVNNYLYIGDSGNATLDSFNVSNPRAPHFGGTVGVNVSKMFASGNYIYTIDLVSSAFYVVDISDPEEMVLVATLTNGEGGAALDFPVGVHVAGNYAYVVSDAGDSLEIIDVGGAVVSNVEIGGAKIDNLIVSSYASLGERVDILGGLNIGAGLFVDGPSAINGGLTIASSTATSATTSPQFLIIGSSNFSPNIMEWRNSGGRALGFIDSSGNIAMGTGLVTSTFRSTSVSTTAAGIFDWGSAGTTGNTYRWLVPRRSSGTCSSGAAEGLIFQTATGTQVGHACIDAYTNNSSNLMKWYAEQFNTTATDVAENYSDVDNVLEAGDVVALDNRGLAEAAVVKTTGAYDVNTMGVVSTRPGILLSGISEDGGKTDLVHPKPIALAGRVPVKVTSENGAIEIGDYIAAGSTPGTAMKATQAGVVIGRALTAYSAEAPTGVVIVLVKTEWWKGPSEGQSGTAFASILSADNNPLNRLTVVGGIDVAGSDIVNIGRIAGVNESWSIDAGGNLVTKGTIATQVETARGAERVYGVTSPGVEVTLSGTGTLEAGRATINLLEVPGGELFSETVSPKVPLKIIVTLTSYANGVYVKSKSHTDFMVEELGVGVSNATFDWVAIGVKKGFEPQEETAEEAPVVVENPVVMGEATAPVEANPSEVNSVPSQEDLVKEEPVGVPAEMVVEQPVVQPVQSESVTEDQLEPISNETVVVPEAPALPETENAVSL